MQRHKRREGRASQRWGDGESGDKQGTSEAFGTVQGKDWAPEGDESSDAKDERGEVREDPDWVTRRRRTLVDEAK